MGIGFFDTHSLYPITSGALWILQEHKNEMFFDVLVRLL